jgi:uncharacterized protein YegL
MDGLPGGEISKRPMHFIWLVDCSGSMAEKGKIESLNNAIREAIPHMQKAAESNPHADPLVRVLKFSTGAQWITNNAIHLSDFKWNDLNAEGETDMGRAFSMVADYLKIPPMTDRGLPPVLVLVSDGQPTDDYHTGLKNLFDQPWARKAVKIAIAIGADADMEVLQKFIGNSERKPLTAEYSYQLVKLIRWASTAALKAASSSPSQSKGATTADSVILPQPPPEVKTQPTADVDTPPEAEEPW